MAELYRLAYNGVIAQAGATINAGDTTITFAAPLTHSGGTQVPTLGTDEYLPLSILDVTGVLQEIVYLTAYTAGATTGTISRAKRGTTAKTHNSGVQIMHAPMVDDIRGRGAWIYRAATAAMTSASGQRTIPCDTVGRQDEGFAVNLAGGTITVPESRWYTLFAHIRISAAVAGYHVVSVGGSTVRGSQIRSTSIEAECSGIDYLAAGTVLSLDYFSGSSTNIVGAANGSNTSLRAVAL